MAYELPIDTGATLHAIKIVEATLNSCWALAEQLKVDVKTAIANAGGSYIDPNNPPEMVAAIVTPTSVTEPTVSIPAALAASDILADFNAEQQTLVIELATKFVAFQTAHFPNEPTTYNAGEQWLQDALANPNAGIPATVASQLLTDDSDRAALDASRAAADVIASFAARRYPLEPGAEVAALVEIEQKAQSEMSASSRKLTSLAIENMRFAVERVVGLRQVAMSSALEYIKALSIGGDQAARSVDTAYGAQSRLISAVSSYYGARTSAKELEFKGSSANAQMSQEAAKANLQSSLTTVDMRLKSLMQEADLLGRLGTALYNNAHISASTSAGFSESQQT